MHSSGLPDRKIEKTVLWPYDGKNVTVGDLRKAIEGFPDEAPIGVWKSWHDEHFIDQACSVTISRDGFVVID